MSIVKLWTDHSQHTGGALNQAVGYYSCGLGNKSGKCGYHLNLLFYIIIWTNLYCKTVNLSRLWRRRRQSCWLSALETLGSPAASCCIFGNITMSWELWCQLTPLSDYRWLSGGTVERTVGCHFGPFKSCQEHSPWKLVHILEIMQMRQTLDQRVTSYDLVWGYNWHSIINARFPW